MAAIRGNDISLEADGIALLKLKPLGHRRALRRIAL